MEPIYDKNKQMSHLEDLADFLDTRFSVAGFRVGWDGIIGLIPGIGDLFTTVMSFYILIQGAALGAPPSVLARMGLNVFIDNILDPIPIIGNIFDFFWKSNTKNIDLLRRYGSDPARTARSSFWMVWLMVFAMIVILGAVAAAMVWLAIQVWAWLAQALA